MRELPSLGFVEAVKLASGRILDFKGRSRRSEFWWWMLVVIIVNWVITTFAPSLLVSGIMSIIIMFFGLAATARRLQDSGKSAVWVYISYALGCATQLYTGASTTVNKIMDELSTGSFSNSAIEKIVEKGSGDLVLLSCLSLAMGIFAIIVIIMCLLDSTRGANKYGESPKYVNE
jgi:uncharacterized membrane protein YhaH (DUF805 family)